MTRLILLIYKVVIPELLSFNIKRIKVVIIVTKVEFVSYYYTKINNDPKKLVMWLFKNANYSMRKKMIRRFYFKSDGSAKLIKSFEVWSDEMKNDKDWKGSLDF